MTKLELLDILDKVFEGQAFYADPQSKFSVIDVPGTGLRFFTYSTDSSKSDCVWYCGVSSLSLISETTEVMIPKEMSREFIEEIYEHSKLLNRITSFPFRAVRILNADFSVKKINFALLTEEF